MRSIDCTFSVRFDFRLRSTRDVLREQPGVLTDVMEADGPARVLFVLDGGVERAMPWLRPAVRRLADGAADGTGGVGDLGSGGGAMEMAGPILRVTGGEACKNSGDAVDAVLDAINAADLDRRSYVVVIGGGAVLDAVGLAAATAHRGVRLVRLPTTTLGQADSGIGVKNAINRYGKKNWQGSFAVPWAVINDRALLERLPDRDFRCGFSEAVKVSLLKEPAFFDWLCDHAADIAGRDAEAADEAIHRSAMWHLKHITRGGDPFEMLEARPLDFGHWSAHKLEPMTDFAVRHGEAVAIGLAVDCVYSSLVHGLSGVDCDRILGCLLGLGLPLSHPLLDEADTLLDGLEEFRQHLGGELTVTMLEAPGRPIDVHRIDHAAMRDAIAEVRGRFPAEWGAAASDGHAHRDGDGQLAGHGNGRAHAKRDGAAPRRGRLTAAGETRP